MRPLAALAALVALASLATPARADVFGPISLVSEGVLEASKLPQQADYAHDPAISADGRYVVFDGSYGGVQGVWRRDLDSGKFEAVTVCTTPSEPHPAGCDAELPSISAEGRYVSFTTTAALTTDDTNPGPDVYVRDMSEQGGAALTLASAADGTTDGLAYEPTGRLSQAFEEHEYGSVAAGRTALSADGRRVAFVTTAVSDLAGKGTPALQVAVRDLDTLTTQLASVAYDPATGAPAVDPVTGAPKPVSGSEGELAYGAVYSPGTPPQSYTKPAPYALAPQVGASISADGSTVAWMGQDVALQAPTLAEEALAPSYAEPLWRRLDDPGAPTRRITGAGDAANPACTASGEAAPLSPPSLADPCQGPFRVEAPLIGTFDEPAIDSIPQLSADGREVAFLANAPLVAQGSDFGSNIENRRGDLYVADMREGLTRTQALEPLTELAGATQSELATNAPIVDLGISPDGKQVAFATQRTVFPLDSPAYVSAPAPAAGLGELFDVDLAEDTLTRVTHGFEGGAGEHPHEAVTAGQDPYSPVSDGALSPSFSADGATLAFSSTASNLVYGDGNTPPLHSGAFDGSDAFAVRRVLFGSQPTPQEISSPPANPPLAPARRLGVTPLSRGDGSVVLYVQAPGPGRLSARAAGEIAVRSGCDRHARVRVERRAVASASAASGADGSARLVLVLAPRYRVLARRAGGLASEVLVSFAAHGSPALRASVEATFSSAHHRHGRARRVVRAGRRHSRRAR
jgi:WD40-like Beta Propeller Repeat